MWFLHLPKSRLRWHLFTWLMAAPALVFVALVQVAGVESGDRELFETRPYPTSGTTDDTRPDYALEYEHGWPCTWLRRGLAYREVETFPYGVGVYRNLRDGTVIETHTLFTSRCSWAEWRAWPLSSHASRFTALGLLVNLCVAMCVVALPMVATEVWLRRRGGFWRFKIIDFLVIVLLFACGFGFYKWDRNQVAREHDLCSNAYRGIRADFHRPLVVGGYVGPEWLVRLLGSPARVSVLHRKKFLDVYTCKSQEARLDRLSELTHIAYVTLHLDNTSDTGIIAELQRFGRLRRIRFGADNRYDLSDYLAALDKLPRLEVVELDCTPLVEDLQALKTLPSLRKVTLDAELITAEELEQLEQALPAVAIEYTEYNPSPYKPERIALAKVNRLYPGRSELSADGLELTWSKAPFTATNLEPLSRVFPKLQVLGIDDAPIDPANLPDLKRFPALTDVKLGSPNLPVEFMEQVADLPNLVKVSIYTRPSTLEPLLALQRRPPPTLFIFRPESFSDEETQSLREAFGDRLQLRKPWKP